MKPKTLTVETTKGTKTYSLTPAAHGFEVHRLKHGFFSCSREYIGHGSNAENAILIARLDAGDSSVRSTKLHG
jgi:hypothetical protein